MAFTRLILPQSSTLPDFPQPLLSIGQSGKGQSRGTLQVGRSWTEAYAPIKLGDTTAEKFLVQAANAFRNADTIDLPHLLKQTLLGTGGTVGAVSVSGAGQTGRSLLTAGWPANKTVLRAGDVFKIAGDNLVYDVTDDATSNGSGVATIPVDPPLFPGNQPASGALLTWNQTVGAVTFHVKITKLTQPTVRAASGGRWHEGLAVTFTEWP